ncbi:hypothetical protein A9W98_10410 [Mycobacterium gordonae]|jgi:hypothetical protein|uniref:Uncharacterized protein n=1 Tax=Mycobacterium gordonae TaxID=1778 RepID=A0A1A6BLR9_MYCGO|nr:hypothetical protein [Mycobacterium gordonae]OBS03280.1 hypothetical protein A9W98_10410 [Mycobacterium gordonae]
MCLALVVCGCDDECVAAVARGDDVVVAIVAGLSLGDSTATGVEQFQGGAGEWRTVGASQVTVQYVAFN